jgi:hypothetical protein
LLIFVSTLEILLVYVVGRPHRPATDGWHQARLTWHWYTISCFDDVGNLLCKRGCIRLCAVLIQCCCVGEGEGNCDGMWNWIRNVNREKERGGLVRKPEMGRESCYIYQSPIFPTYGSTWSERTGFGVQNPVFPSNFPCFFKPVLVRFRGS